MPPALIKPFALQFARPWPKISFWGMPRQRRCSPTPLHAKANIVAHQRLVVAGITLACEVFAEVDPAIKIRKMTSATIGLNAMILNAEGDARSLLMAERVALNFIQRLSGIATLTARFCEAIKGYPTRILDTRKTTPGLRALGKWAVRLGGGFNHRHSLGDGILIKDNHIELLKSQDKSVTDACRLAREHGPHGLRIIVEAQSHRSGMRLKAMPT